MNVYQHVIPSMHAEAADTFSRLLHDDQEPEDDRGDEPPDPVGTQPPAA